MKVNSRLGNRAIVSELAHLARGDRMDRPDRRTFGKLLKAYEKNPERVEGILEKAEHDPTLAQEVTYDILGKKKRWYGRKKAIAGAIAGLALLVTNQDFLDEVGIYARDVAYSGVPTWYLSRLSDGGKIKITAGGQFIELATWYSSLDDSVTMLCINGKYDSPNCTSGSVLFGKEFKLGKK